jgi:hypothetical protein
MKKHDLPERAVCNDLSCGKRYATNENDWLGPSRCFSATSLGGWRQVFLQSAFEKLRLLALVPSCDVL